MKSKTITQIVLLSLLCLIAIPMVQATKPEKIVVHDVYEGIFNGGWCKAVTHGTTINKGEVLEGYNVVMYMLQKIIIYEHEGGDIVAILKINMHYIGTITGFEGETPFETLYTGKLVFDVVLNELKEGILPLDKPQQSHGVIWFVEGDIVKSNGFGEFPF